MVTAISYILFNKLASVRMPPLLFLGLLIQEAMLELAAVVNIMR